MVERHTDGHDIISCTFSFRKTWKIFETSTKFLLHEKLDVKKRAILTLLPQRMDYLQIHSIPKVSNILFSQRD